MPRPAGPVFAPKATSSQLMMQTFAKFQETMAAKFDEAKARGLATKELEGSFERWTKLVAMALRPPQIASDGVPVKDTQVALRMAAIETAKLLF